MDSNTPFWANRGRRGEETGPFWANRGRRTGSEKRPSEIMQPDPDEWNTQLEEPLYVEEPRWILVRRDDERRASSYIAPDYKPYFVTRGKRPIHDKPRRDVGKTVIQTHRVIHDSNINHGNFNDDGPIQNSRVQDPQMDFGTTDRCESDGTCRSICVDKIKRSGSHK